MLLTSGNQNTQHPHILFHLYRSYFTRAFPLTQSSCACSSSSYSALSCHLYIYTYNLYTVLVYNCSTELMYTRTCLEEVGATFFYLCHNISIIAVFMKIMQNFAGSKQNLYMDFKQNTYVCTEFMSVLWQTNA